MQKNLVIVESPAKAKTIEKFLGKEFKVLSSYGHIRDLKRKEFSIDVENNFKPEYEVPSDKKSLVSELKSEAKKADMVWLASDEDREGEAISWHLYEVLGLKPEKTKRIVFHEITKPAILHAIENPREIDDNLVNAQQARRILDRIVGFELSPVLWKKVKPALSAGRVQSVAVRLIIEREREIQKFKSESSYRVTALFLVKTSSGEETELKGELTKRLKSKKAASDFLKSCLSANFKIEDIVKKPSKRYPAAPFTTSTLQQEASRKLGFSVGQTMMIAQRLYESGQITYMRTDSTNLSGLAVQKSKEVITELMGEQYVHPRQYATKAKGAQEAHEAIRPTYMDKTVATGSAQEKRLYELIWKRTIASQMAEAKLEKTTVTIGSEEVKDRFTATGEVVKFDGFLRVYRESYDEDHEAYEINSGEDTLLPPLTIGEELQNISITATERFTQKPPRYTEASLVRKMEELGIGRPSTYAPTISTIQQREYVEKGDREGMEREYNVMELRNKEISDKQETERYGAEKSKLFPTDVGMVVSDFLTEYFPNILDYNFTATVEKEFDDVAEGKKEWTDIMHNFYEKFHPAVKETLAIKTERKIGERLLGEDPKSGKPITVKIGRYGPVVQMGSASDEEKPKFAQMRPGMSMETLTLEEALDLFKLPRTVGEFEEKEVVIGVGRFGPYIRHNSKFVSLPKEYDPLKVSLEESIELIKAKREAEAKKHIKSFEEEPEMTVLNGRYGPYISYKRKNYKIPKEMKPEELTLEQCNEIIEKQKSKPTRKRGAKKTTKAKKK